MGFTIGMPSLKLSNIDGKGGKHCGNFAKIAKEALQERLGQDLDINHDLTGDNFYAPIMVNVNGDNIVIKRAADLQAYSEKWIADRNAEIENHNAEIAVLVETVNAKRQENGQSKLSEKEVLKILNADRKKKGIEPLKRQRKIRTDAVVMCATVIKPPQEFMATLTRDEQERFLLDGLEKFKEIVGAENVKSAVIHRDELVPHIHIFWQPVTDDGRLCAKEKHNIRFFGRLNREMPKFLREKGWKEIDDCDAYDIEEAQEIRETKGEEAYREYNENRRREKLAKGKKSGRDSKTFKGDMDKAVAEEQQLVMQAQTDRDAAEEAALKARAELAQAETKLSELRTAQTDEIFARVGAIKAIGEKLSGGAKKLTASEVDAVLNMTAILGQAVAEYERLSAEQEQAKKACESVQNELQETLGNVKEKIDFEAHRLAVNAVVNHNRKTQKIEKQLADDLEKARSEGDTARKERDEARKVCEWLSREPYERIAKQYRKTVVRGQWHDKDVAF